MQSALQQQQILRGIYQWIQGYIIQAAKKKKKKSLFRFVVDD